ncbi:MAG: large conductance mechanosensitive channel protein MscL [Clostridia bacterium]|nr:large conductance mechanosensitive channel protein MscL [Clostridia bacterium]
MSKFAKEFKAFITRGNVLDMAVGVIIGGAFSAIVTALTNHILMPVINWFLLLITGGNGLDSIYTYLNKAYQVDEAGNAVLVNGEKVVDVANSIYIDWGAFITAIINFILIALVLFLIIKAFNKAHEAADNARCGFSQEEYKKLVKEGKSPKEIRELAAKRDLEAAEAAKKAEEEAAAKAAEPSSTDKLLMEIRDSLKNR